MTQLLNAYRADPSFRNACKLRTYELAHPMAVCMLTQADLALLNAAIAKANHG